MKASYHGLYFNKSNYSVFSFKSSLDHLKLTLLGLIYDKKNFYQVLRVSVIENQRNTVPTTVCTEKSTVGKIGF